MSFDSIAEFTDNNGDSWRAGAEFKMIHGRMHIAAITIWSTEKTVRLTRQVLRDLPLNRLFEDDLAIESRTNERRIARTTQSAHQGRAHSAEELRAVADIYLAAYRAHRPVQQAVAQALGVPVSTAAKRIMAARQMGLLDEVDEGAV
jgi:hypothetical protein